MGYPVSALLEAVHAPAVFHSNPDVDPERDIHVTMKGTWCSRLPVPVSRAH